MAGSLTNKDTYVPTAEELQEQFNAPSYRKEESETAEKNELTTEQINEVKNLLKKANEKHPGVICPRDEVKYLAYLERDCTPQQRQEAIEDLPEHLEKKAAYLEEYEEELRKHFSLHDDLTPQGQKLLENYKNMTGVERKQAAKTLQSLIKERVREKKSFQELLTESPHFSEEGELTPKAEEMNELFQKAEGGVQKNMKRRLIETLRQYDRVEKECEHLYKAANGLYEKGQFLTAELLLETIIKLCEKNGNSPRMQVIQEWNQRDLENLKDHTLQQREINKKLLLRDAFIRSGDEASAVEVSAELTDLSQQFLDFTTDRNGQVVPRKEKYKTPYLKNLAQELQTDHQALEDVKQERDSLQEEVDSDAINKNMMKYMSSDKGKTYAVEMGVLEEELAKTDEQERTDERAVLDVDPDSNEDIMQLTDFELDGNQEDENEVVMDFTQSRSATNQYRSHRLSQLKNVNTGVSKDGRLVTNINELQNLTDQRTDQFIDDFLGDQQKQGEISGEHLDQFHTAMHELTKRGEVSRSFTADSRSPGREEVEFGGRFQQTAQELAQNIADQGMEEIQKAGQVTNLAEALRKKRQEYRRAA
ncbi:MAG: hypothetical protein AB7J40_04455 [Candidatus Altimarinota bacterium]